MRFFILYITTSLFLIGGLLCQTPCDIPIFLVGTQWWESSHGLVDLGSTNMTGYDIRFFGCKVIQDWDCYFQEVTITGAFIVWKARETHLSFNLRSYLCMNIFAVKPHLYYYTLESAYSTDYDERVTQVDDSMVISNAKTDLCVQAGDPDYPDPREYKILVEAGYESDVIENCHANFQERFTYSLSHGSTSQQKCTNQDNVWDACTDTTMMTFDNTCPETIAYAEGREVSCIYNLNAGGSLFYQTVFSYDNTTSDYTFTCFAVDSIPGSNGLYVTQSAGSCQAGQDPQTPVDDYPWVFTLMVRDDTCGASNTTTGNGTSTDNKAGHIGTSPLLHTLLLLVSVVLVALI